MLFVAAQNVAYCGTDQVKSDGAAQLALPLRSSLGGNPALVPSCERGNA